MRAAHCWDPRVLVDSMVAARGALSTCVRRPRSFHDNPDAFPVCSLRDLIRPSNSRTLRRLRLYRLPELSGDDRPYLYTLRWLRGWTHLYRDHRRRSRKACRYHSRRNVWGVVIGRWVRANQTPRLGACTRTGYHRRFQHPGAKGRVTIRNLGLLDHLRTARLGWQGQVASHAQVGPVRRPLRPEELPNKQGEPRPPARHAVWREKAPRSSIGARLHI